MSVYLFLYPSIYPCIQSHLQERNFNLVTFIDTPGLVDGSFHYPFPVEDILVSMARHTDLIYIFFGAHGLTRNLHPSLYIYISICLSIYPSIYTFPSPSRTSSCQRPATPTSSTSSLVRRDIYKSISIYLSIYPSIYSSIHLYIPFPIEDILVSMARHNDLIYIFFGEFIYLYLFLHTHTQYVCIYIHIFMYVCTYLYIYI